jgi:magnesium transporter
MMTIWKQTSNGLTQIEKFEKNCWIDVVNPTNSEIDALRKEHNIPEDLLTDIQDVDERSRVEVEGRWLLIIMRIPVYIEKDGFPYYTIPMFVFVSPLLVITISLYSNDITDVAQLVRYKSFTLNNKHNFILFLLFRASKKYLDFLKILDRQTNQIEKDLRKSTKNSELLKLLRVERCLVYFITSLKSNEILITKLQRTKFADSKQIDQDLLEDVIIENRQAAETANVHSDILSGLMDSFASVISNNLNIVMKELTLITITLMIPTLVASLFGMNVPNIWQNNPFGFIYAVLASVVLAIIVVLFFRRRY